MLPTFLALLVLLALLALLAASHATSSSPLHHLPLTRRPVPTARLFSHAHRPWAWHPSYTGEHLLAPTSLTRQLRLPSTREQNKTHLPHQPVFGDIVNLGEYYVTLSVGGQFINVQVDTGSSTLAVPLKQCQNCRPHNHRLDLDAATGTAGFIGCGDPACRKNSCNLLSQCTVCSVSTHACCSEIAPQACGFFLRYADQSGASGALVQADVAIAGMEVPLVFGAILKETDDFENTNVDGIFGMAYPSLACNPTCVSPLFDTLVDVDHVKRDVFSICTATHGGTLTLGGSSPHFYHGELQYVPMVKKGSAKHFYDISVKSVKIDGKMVNVPDFKDGIVDSGTTVLVLAPNAYNALKDHFQSNYCEVPGLCVAESGKQLNPARVVKRPSSSSKKEKSDLSVTAVREEDATWFSPGYCVRLSDYHLELLPNITLVLDGGVELVLEPQTYMLKYVDTSNFAWKKIEYWCLGISYLEGLQRMENNAVLGNTVLQKYFVEYDRENSRIGFAVAKNCVDPAARLLGFTSPTGSGKIFSLPHWTVVVLIIASVFSWVLLVSMCAREKRREGYRNISGTAQPSV